jgi:hypothetical protein
MRNFVIPDIRKISAVFSALQMLILSAAELQIRQDEGYDRLFADWQGLPALQAGASLETCFYLRRRLQPAPSEGGISIAAFF